MWNTQLSSENQRIARYESEHGKHLRSFASRGKQLSFMSALGGCKSQNGFAWNFICTEKTPEENKALHFVFSFQDMSTSWQRLDPGRFPSDLSELSMPDSEPITSFFIFHDYISHLGNIITILLIVIAQKLMYHSL